MSPRAPKTASRREFLKLATLGGAALVVVIPQLGCGRAAAADGPPLEADQWISIGPDGAVTFVLDKSEMGQGVTTALPMIMAEELGVELSSVRVTRAVPGPRFTDMGTSGSGSVTGAWFAHRLAAARARSMLVAAAATQWGVSPAECEVVAGEVRARGSRRRARFGDLVPAARLLTPPKEPTLRTAAEYRLLGTRVADPGLGQIVAGRMQYGLDVRVPGMLFATIARCPVHGGTLRRVDDTKARAVEGVRNVVTIDRGVAVVATSTWGAMKGREALGLEWNEGANATFDNDAGWRLLDIAMTRRSKVARNVGDAPRALAGAARRLAAEYRWPWQAHAAIEPLSCVAHLTGGRCEVWAGTQNPNDAQQAVATALGLAPEQVVVHVERLGGGFGRRIAVDHIVEAALVAKTIAAPVQVVWTREDDVRHDFYNPAQVNKLEAGLDDHGRAVAWWHRVGDFHLSMFGPWNATNDPATDGDPWGGIDSPYAMPDLRVELAVAESPVPTGAWRAVSYPAAVMARECFIDEIARATGTDGVALRLSLIPSPGTVTRRGVALHNGDRLRRVLALAAQQAGWDRPMSARRDGRRVGRGIACNAYHGGTMVAQVAEVSVGDGGDVVVHRLVSAVDCGQVINRSGVEKQVEGAVAWALSAAFGPGITFERGRTVNSGFGDYPVVRLDQMPELETHFVESTLRPFGMGEPPVPAVIPAVLNAVLDATGVRVRALPLERTMLARTV